MITNLEPILAEHPFTKQLPQQYLQLITGCASNVRFEAGQQIYRSGDDSNTFYIIRSGKVAVELSVPGKGSVTIETLGAGDVLGWSWLFPPYRRHFDARAVELCRAIALDGKCLRTKCDADPAMGYELVKRAVKILISRLYATRLQILDVYGAKQK